MAYKCRVLKHKLTTTCKGGKIDKKCKFGLAIWSGVSFNKIVSPSQFHKKKEALFSFGEGLKFIGID
jgi:hypothetical protein